MALLLKSVRGYAESVGLDDGILGNAGILQLVEQVKEQGLDSLASTDPASAAASLRALLTPSATARLSLLVNPELLSMLDTTDPQLLAFGTREVLASLEEFGAFSVADDWLFFRPGLVDFDAAAGTTFARAGDFYAGYGPSDAAGMRHFLDACAAPTAGLVWIESERRRRRVAREGERRDVVRGPPRIARDRVHERERPERPDVRVAHRRTGRRDARRDAATSIVTGASVDAYAAGRAAYVTGQYPTGDVPFAVSFDDVKFGYWGAAGSLATILANPPAATPTRRRRRRRRSDTRRGATCSRARPPSPGSRGSASSPTARGGSRPAAGRICAGAGAEEPRLRSRRVRHAPPARERVRGRRRAEARDVARRSGGALRPREPRERLQRVAPRVDRDVVHELERVRRLAARRDGRRPDRAPLETSDSFFAGYAGVTPRAGFAGCTPGVAQ